MGQKVNPIGFRLGVNRDWRSRWYASPQELPAFLHSDLEIRSYVKKKLQFAAVSKIVIERAWNSIRVTIFTARPGIVIGRKGAEIEKMTEEISKMAQGKQIKIDIQEIKSPELDAQLVAENVALQIERRIAYRRAMKKAVQTAMTLAPREFGCGVLAGSMARRFRVRNGIEREKSRCIPCARRLITGSRKQTRSMVRSALNAGCVKRKNQRLSQSYRRHPHPSRLKSKEKIYAVNAKTREVSKDPARKPKGNGFAQSKNRFWRVRFADIGTRLDHQHAARSRARRAHSQYETQGQTVDPYFPG